MWSKTKLKRRQPLKNRKKEEKGASPRPWYTPGGDVRHLFSSVTGIFALSPALHTSFFPLPDQDVWYLPHCTANTNYESKQYPIQEKKCRRYYYKPSSYYLRTQIRGSLKVDRRANPAKQNLPRMQQKCVASTTTSATSKKKGRGKY